jgi:hypothetical protein
MTWVAYMFIGGTALVLFYENLQVEEPAEGLNSAVPRITRTGMITRFLRRGTHSTR